MSSDHTNVVKQQLLNVFDDAFQHDGFGNIKVEIKILKRQQKEVIIHYGKQYRYVLDYVKPKSKDDPLSTPASSLV